MNNNKLIGAAFATVAFVYLLRSGVLSLGSAINPLNQDNIFSEGADALTQTFTGDSETSLGSTIYDWFNDNPEI